MEKKDIYTLYLDFCSAMNDSRVYNALDNAHDVSLAYAGLMQEIGKMSEDDAESIIKLINKAIRLYIEYDEITTKIYRLSNKYDK